MNYVAPTSPLSVGGVLDNCLRLFRESFDRCWALAAVNAAAAGFLVFLANPLAPPPAMTVAQRQMQLWSMLHRMPDPFAISVQTLIDLLLMGAIVAAQVAVIRGEPAGFVGALMTGVRRFPRVLWGFVLWLLAAIGITAACLAPLIIMGAVVLALENESRIGIVTRALIVATSAGGYTYAGVRLGLWLPAIFVDDDSAIASLRRSSGLVSGQWWRTAVTSFVAAVILLVLSYVVPWLVAAALVLSVARGGDVTTAISNLVVVKILAQATRVFTLPLGAALWIAIYHDLKLRREGADLAARAAELSGA